jgi:hypothetical protein
MAWGVALTGYFGPWVGHKSAALAWNAYDLFDILRFLPQIETFAIVVNLQALRLPLVGLAVLLPLILAEAHPGWRWLAALIGIILAVETLPPYPGIIGAWRAPGWRVPFWWGIGAALGTIVSALFAHRWQLRPWLIVSWTALTGIPAFVTFNRLLPALRELYQSPLHPGWGFWICAAGLLALALLAWLRAFLSPKEGKMIHQETEEEVRMEKVLQVKRRHEATLLHKANVVGVGIGIAHHEEDETRKVSRSVVLVVNVTHKVPDEDLDPEDRIPEELEGIPVQIKAIGYPQAQD